MAGREGAHARDDGADLLGDGRAVAFAHLLQVPLDDARPEFPGAQVAQGWDDLVVQPVAVHAQGAWGAALVAQVGVPGFGQRRHSRVGADGLAAGHGLPIAQGFAEPVCCLGLGGAMPLDTSRDAVEVAVLDAGTIAGRGGVRGDHPVGPQR